MNHGEITELPSSREDLIAYRIAGDLSVSNYDAIIDRLIVQLDKGPFDLFVRVERMGRIEWGALRDVRVRRLKREGMSKIRRYAIVGAPDWIEGLVKLVNPFINVEARAFGEDREAEAWAWLDEGRGTSEA